MSNTITAYFKGRVGVAEAVYQNDYGIVMAFDSIDLPAHFDCYFSRLNQEEALPGVGADSRVAIPNSILADPGNVTVHVPLHTGENDSEVEYVVYFKVIGRARPIDDGTPTQMTAIERALALLSQPITNIEEIVNEALSFTGDTFAEMKQELQDDFDNYTETLEGDLATWKGGVESDIDDVEADFAVLQGQFDTAVAAVTTDTEVTDIRVGADGVTDTTAGASVRRQFTDLKSDLSNAVMSNGQALSVSTELFDQDDATLGRALWSNTDEENANYGYTGYIDVSKGDVVIANASGNGNIICYYDANKTRIPPNGTIRDFDSDNLPSGTVYVRFNFALSTINSVSVTKTIQKNCISTEIISDFDDKIIQPNGNTTTSYIELFDETKAITGRSLYSDTDEANANYGYTDYIDVSDGNITIANAEDNNNTIVYYDANKTRISPNGVVKNFDSSNLPTGAVFIRFNFVLSTIDSVSVRKEVTLNCISTEIISDYPKHTTLYLGTGCQFTTLKSAVEYANSIASKYNVVDIMIKEGVYDVFDGYDLTAQPANWWGLYVEDYVNLIGIGSADKVVINGVLPVDISAYAFDRQNISTINLWKNNTVKNMTITAKNIRYCIHNEDGKSEAVDNAKELFENVVFVFYENDTGIITSRVPVGIGASHGRYTKFKNCVFDNRSANGNYPVLLHNNTTIDTYCEWDFESCDFVGGILNSLKLSSAGSGQTEIVNIKGCKMPHGILFTKENVYTGSTCEYKLFGYGNSIQGGYTFDGVTEDTSVTDMML